MVRGNARAAAKRAGMVFRLGHTPVLTHLLARKKQWFPSIPAGTCHQPIVNLPSLLFTKLLQRPGWVKSRHTATAFSTSAFGGEADVNHSPVEGPLIAKSGHDPRGYKSENLRYKSRFEAGLKLPNSPYLSKSKRLAVCHHERNELRRSRR